MAKVDGKGAFGVPGGDVWADVPDGVTRAYDDGGTRNSLQDARFVSNYGSSAFGYDAFRNESYPDGFLPGPGPMGDDDGSLGTVTGVSNKNPIGRQR